MERFSIPDAVIGVSLDHQAPGLRSERQLGIRIAGLMLTVLPLMAVTLTSCCCWRPLRPVPDWPSLAHTLILPHTQTPPLSVSVSFIWSRIMTVPTFRLVVALSVICVLPGV